MKLTIGQFRNIDRAIITLDTPAVIVGRNGRGKTNLLESLYVSQLGSSFRQVTTDDLIADGAPESSILVETDHRDGCVLRRGLPKQFARDGKREPLHDRCGRLPLILFAPEEFLFFVSAEYRRHWLNRLLIQTDQRYRAQLLRYRQLLRQRNYLLRHFLPSSAAVLESFDQELLPLAQEIQSRRRATIAQLALALGGRVVGIQYLPSERSAADQSRELVAKTTLRGPHRDEVLLLYRGQNSLTHASRGEQRLCLLALVLAEEQLLHFSFHLRPLLLLDDLFAELDTAHRIESRSLFAHSSYLLTTTELTVIPPAIRSTASLVDLDHHGNTQSDCVFVAGRRQR